MFLGIVPGAVALQCGCMTADTPRITDVSVSLHTWVCLSQRLGVDFISVSVVFTVLFTIVCKNCDRMQFKTTV